MAIGIPASSRYHPEIFYISQQPTQNWKTGIAYGINHRIMDQNIVTDEKLREPLSYIFLYVIWDAEVV